MTSTVIYPTVVDNLGNTPSPRDEDYIEGYIPGEPSPYATANVGPLGWNGGRPDKTRQVGWTLHRKGSNNILHQHAFSINPQAITRTPSNRNQMFATQGGFYVDDFGAGSETIQITQLVAHGRGATIGGSLQRATMRDDVVRFYDNIYTLASANPGQYEVYFHDNHFWAALDARVPEKVYFPPQAFQLVRSVQLQNVWQLSLTMQTLQAPPNAVQDGLPTPTRPKIRVHIVRRGETLKKIARRLAGHHHHHQPTHKRVLQIEQQVIALTRKYGQDDITKTRVIPTYRLGNPPVVAGTVTVHRMHITAGEKIIVPAG